MNNNIKKSSPISSSPRITFFTTYLNPPQYTRTLVKIYVRLGSIFKFHAGNVNPQYTYKYTNNVRKFVILYNLMVYCP